MAVLFTSMLNLTWRTGVLQHELSQPQLHKVWSWLNIWFLYLKIRVWFHIIYSPSDYSSFYMCSCNIFQRWNKNKQHKPVWTEETILNALLIIYLNFSVSKIVIFIQKAYPEFIWSLKMQKYMIYFGRIGSLFLFFFFKYFYYF